MHIPALKWSLIINQFNSGLLLVDARFLLQELLVNVASIRSIKTHDNGN